MLSPMFFRIINGLDCCSNRPKNCSNCQYQGYKPPDGGDYPNCQELLMIDANSMLRYPEEREVSGDAKDDL